MYVKNPNLSIGFPLQRVGDMYFRLVVISSKIMRILIVTLFALFSFSFSEAQVYNPVKWSFSHQLEGDDHAILKFTAKIDAGWHVYSTTIEDGIGPIPTSFDFQSLEGAELVGGLVEPKPHKEYDPNFDMELLWFEKQVTLQQKVKLTKPFAKVTGELTYMTCDDSKCLPPEYLEFDFDIEQALKSGGESGAVTPAEVNDEPSAVDAGSLNEDQPALTANSNIETPVKWKIIAEKIDDKTYIIRAKASIAEGWHVYSKDLPNESAAFPTYETIKQNVSHLRLTPRWIRANFGADTEPGSGANRFRTRLEN